MSEERSSKGESSGDPFAGDRGGPRGKTTGRDPGDAGSIPARSTIPDEVRDTLFAALDVLEDRSIGADEYRTVNEAQRWLAFADEEDGTLTRQRAAAELSVALWLAAPVREIDECHHLLYGAPGSCARCEGT